MKKRVELKKLATGVPGLDEVLGGGLPEFSFNLISGSPGCGKTTLAHQIVFANATPERPALYVTILGEPPLKMLRYQQQFHFFDGAKVPKALRFLHIDADILAAGLERVLEKIVSEVEATAPKIVVVDSFRAAIRRADQPGQLSLQDFVQSLSIRLTSWEATTFLIGEYLDTEKEDSPVFTVADGIFHLSQASHRSSIVRKLQIVKMRGQGQIPGHHTVKMSDGGIKVYPRLIDQRPKRQESGPPRKTGVPELDAMLRGGVPAGSSVMIVGPSGSGKTVLAAQFIRAGIEDGEPGVIAVFEKRPDDYLVTIPSGLDLERLVKADKVRVLYLRPLDLSVDETFEAIQTEIKAIGAKRLVIDSLMGLELALAPPFREDFRESLYRMVGALTSLGVTIMMTAEVVDSFEEFRLNPQGLAFLTDAIILQRYVEMHGRLERVMSVVKLRGHDHAKELRPYTIGPTGFSVGKPLSDYEHLLIGAPTGDLFKKP